MSDPETLWQVLETEFVKSLAGSAVGALAGAAAGAWAAQRIAERSKIREDLLKEVRNVNAAVTMAYGITDAFVNIKQQHIKPINERFHASKAALLAYLKDHREGEVFKFEADMLNLPLFPRRLTQCLIRLSTTAGRTHL